MRKAQPVFKRYTLLFILFAALCLFMFSIIQNKTLISLGDGIDQQYVYFMYTGVWIKHLFKNLFVDHVLELPSWSMSGYGFDIFKTLGESLVDPFNWLSALAPLKFGEAAFLITLCLKYYTAGISFIFYCRHKKVSDNGAVIGALIYVFSGIAKIGIMQLNFMNSFILFPLLLIAVDKLWYKKAYLFYTVVLAICTISSSYFTFMMGIVVVLICALRFFTDKDRSVKLLVSQLGRFIVFTILGIGIACVTLSTVMGVLVNDRLSDKYVIDLFYSKYTITQILSGMFSCGELMHDCYFGISAFLVPCAYMLFKKKESSLTLKIIFVLGSVTLFLPAVGSFFNGMNYPSHRYIFMVALLFAYIIADNFDDILRTSRKERLILGGITLVYSVVIPFTYSMGGIFSMVSLWIVLGYVCLADKFSDRMKKVLPTAAVLITCIMSTCAYMFNWSAYLLPYGVINVLEFSYHGRDSMDIDADLSDIRYDRVNKWEGVDIKNTSLLIDAVDYDFYHSTTNQRVIDLTNDIGIADDPRVNAYSTPRGRNFFEIVNGTRYIVIQPDLPFGAPYSYSENEEYSVEGKAPVYTADAPVSMVFFYDDTVSMEDYESLSPVLREELLMNSMVLEDSGNTSTSDMDFTAESIDYSVAEQNGLVMSDGKIIVTGEEGGYLRLEFDPVSSSEIYVELDRLLCDKADPANADTPDYCLTTSLYGGEDVLRSDRCYCYRSDSTLYYYRPFLVFAFSPCEGEADSVLIRFESKGVYDIDDLKIYKRSTEDIDSVVASFEEHARIADVDYDINGNHIDISASGSGWLYIAVPYSEGWSAVVDGQEAQIVRANRAYMAVWLGEGEHVVAMRFRTPYLKEGCCISLASVIILSAICVIDRKRKSSDKSQK